MSVVVGLSSQPISSGSFQDFIDVNAFNGETPKLAILAIGQPSGLNQDTSHYIFSLGATDGTNEKVTATRNQDSVSTFRTRTRMRDKTAYIFNSDNNDPVAGEATISGVGLIPNGLRINWTSNSGVNTIPRLATCTLFGGNEFDGCVGSYYRTGGSVDDTFAVSGIGFEPDVVLFLNTLASGSEEIGPSYIGMGFATNESPIKQGFAAMIAGTTVAWVGNYKTNQYANQRLILLSNSVFEEAADEITSFNNDGFEITRKVNTNALGAVFIAMKFGKRRFWADFYSLRSSGVQRYTDIGFKPQLIFGAGVPQLKAPIPAQSGLNVGTFVFNVATHNRQFCYNFANLDGSNPSDVSSRTTDKLFQLTNSSGSLVTTGRLSKFTPAGFNVTNTLVDDDIANQHFWGLVVQDKDQTIRL